MLCVNNNELRHAKGSLKSRVSVIAKEGSVLVRQVHQSFRMRHTFRGFFFKSLCDKFV